MNFSLNRDTAFLNADEASAVETAVRTAVMSILKVFCEVNEKRSHCYEAKLAEAERENTALKIQLKAAEQELQTLRQISTNYKISAEVTFTADVEETGPEPASFQNVSESDSVPVLKEEEEPFYQSSLFIKSEMTEEYSAVDFENAQICQQTAQIQTYVTHNTHAHSLHSDPVLTGSEKKRLTRYENVRRYRERIRADPVKYLAWKEKNHLRYLQNRKTINELPEPMKNLQRKAWREATRRHRAKKLAQAALSASSMSQTPSL
ncbi:hypothetical protein KOW79_019032 [Hemibagrus wyckioides]|uniref:Uncharacterized protein n=1 Tax=Hemibagrus wyckioides TaxID=337641 RepID=A0A9D3N9A6_9TELE|nr:uncharacterized protein LOC131344054 isoform X1 [Hemibagrus wyckioides]XP_058231980.1 uncharacterized protein LOC131344054 isoform X1 [Hemibagrus wyckioides]KAG7317997.1 hypothetical protein KOW79_019032 [Hemibagrus wyckioides]